MRKTLTTAGLLLAFSCPALAGEIHTPPAPQSPTVTAQEPTTTDEDTGAADTLIQTALTVLMSLLP
jgi:hypothetical protein